jgi:hypothetical protein
MKIQTFELCAGYDSQLMALERLKKKYSDFDVRNYGYSSLSTFLEEMESLELKKFNNTVLVRLKEDKNMKEQVMEYAVNYVKSSENAVELGALGQKIHMN